ncbi:phage tail tape measure protein [Rhizobium sp. RU36D]|uniref:phage tail tape measure protein n=1 Tax=Rhizobium sp. RU36D TaxID=1907415 RepID=UPI0009D88103|nr:phage tail tape measure protein [Rhizobium sp. RU36D]SMD18478.1 phage tail tape measure protein, TP901 family, core region [Rhizobium sp. RU36D]
MANRQIKAELEIDGKDNTSAAFKSVAARMGQVEKQIARFNRTAEAFNSRVGQIQRSASGYNRVMEQINKTTDLMRIGIMGYGALEVGRFVQGAVLDFAALERQMGRIGITAGASAEQTESAFAAVQKISKDLSYDSVQPAIDALDTLVASGKSLDEALAFLPSVLATAQATGAATSDIANTGLKAADALKIEATQLQRAFDIMVTGGKAGQFELKDMAQYIPGLANSFATLGYKGEEGLKQLVAILQTIREDTGDASSAATQAQNIFGKMFSEETSNKFKKFGIDLRSEMQAAAKAGEDAVSAFVRLSNEAIDGDLSKLPLLFSDQEFRLGMQSLMTSPESLQKFFDVMNSAEVDGTVFRDVQRVIGDTQGSIDRMASSWEKLKTSMGGAIAGPATAVMDAATSDLDRGTAIRKALEDQGMGYLQRESWMALNMPLGSWSQGRELDKLALKGGYSDPEFIDRMRQGPVRPEFEGPQMPEFPGFSRPRIPVPRPGSLGEPVYSPTFDAAVAEARRGMPSGPIAPPTAPIGASTLSDAAESVRQLRIELPDPSEIKDALKIDLGFREEGDYASRSIAAGGKDAAAEIEKSAAFIKVAGYDVSGAIMDAARQLTAAAGNLSGAIGRLGNFSNPPRPVSGNMGESMPASANRPASPGRRT